MIVVETANVRTMLLVLEACASANLDGMAPLVKNMDVLGMRRVWNAPALVTA